MIMNRMPTYIVLCALLLAVFGGCEKEDPSESLFPHKDHIAGDVPASCTACHAVSAEKVGYPGMQECRGCHLSSEDEPWLQDCTECHEVNEEFLAHEGSVYHRKALNVPKPSGYEDVYFDHTIVVSETTEDEEMEYESSYPHRPHQDLGTTCEMCHQVQQDKITYPKVDSCLTCHVLAEDDSMAKTCGQCHEINDDFAASGGAIRHRDAFGAPKPASFESVEFNHDEMGADAESCMQCHGGDSGMEPYVPVHLPSMADSMSYVRSAGQKTSCLDCHVKREVPENDLCMSCHGTGRNEVGLASMDASIETLEDRGMESECSMCHRELDETSVPDSHRRGDWHRTHGFAQDLIDRGQCAICHDDNTCDMCHAVEQPRSHTNIWRTRVHGLEAQYERDRCMVCHREDSCEQCHREVLPRSHRGGWGPPQNRHCMRCHVEFGESVSCYACHRQDRVEAVHRVESQTGFADPILAQVHTSGQPCLRCHETLVPDHGLFLGEVCTHCHRF